MALCFVCQNSILRETTVNELQGMRKSPYRKTFILTSELTKQQANNGDKKTQGGIVVIAGVTTGWTLF